MPQIFITNPLIQFINNYIFVLIGMGLILTIIGYWMYYWGKTRPLAISASIFACLGVLSILFALTGVVAKGVEKVSDATDYYLITTIADAKANGYIPVGNEHNLSYIDIQNKNGKYDVIYQFNGSLRHSVYTDKPKIDNSTTAVIVKVQEMKSGNQTLVFITQITGPDKLISSL